jgi:tetratricopeptide (TPR) repeat protein
VKRGVLALVALLAACGGAPPAPAPTAPQAQSQTRLAEAEGRAAAMVRSGDFAGAAREYAEAVRLAASVENADAIAANAINLSIVDQWLGREAEAREALARVTDDTQRGFSERRRQQAELRRAILELAGSNIDVAATWAGRAEKRCANLSCEYAAAILNTQAQIALAGARHADGARLAASAAERARSRNDRTETANALRTLGRAQRLQGNAATALPNLEQALALDRDLGDPRKILADLTELAMASDAAGNREAARNYYVRAVAVSKAMDDSRGIAEMETQLKRP